MCGLEFDLSSKSLKVKSNGVVGLHIHDFLLSVSNRMSISHHIAVIYTIDI